MRKAARTFGGRGMGASGSRSVWVCGCEDVGRGWSWSDACDSGFASGERGVDRFGCAFSLSIFPSRGVSSLVAVLTVSEPAALGVSSFVTFA